jgi:hypothetical protein
MVTILPLRPVLLAVDDRRPDPVAGLPERRVRQAHQHETDQPVLDVDLDLHRWPWTPTSAIEWVRASDI